MLTQQELENDNIYNEDSIFVINIIRINQC